MQTKSTCLKALRNRSAIIAEGWHDIVLRYGFAPYSAEEVRLRLVSLTDRMIELLFDERPVAEAREIGASLVNLHLIQSEFFGQSQTYLLRELSIDMPADLVVSLQPRLAALLGEIATAYLQHSQQTILHEQEGIREAFTIAQKQLERSVRRSEQRYRTLVESAAQAIFIVDGEGEFRFMNSSASRQLGGVPSDFVGKTMWDLFPHDVANAQMTSVRKVLAERTPQVTETTTVLQGKRHWRETGLQPVADSSGSGEAVLGISTDVTERKEAESALKLYSERLALLRALDYAILAAQSPQAIAATASKHVQRIIPCWGLKVVLYDLDNARFLVLAGEMEGFSNGEHYPIEDWWMLDQMRRGDSVLLTDIKEIWDRSRVWRLLREAGGRAFLNVPLVAHGELIGAFNLIGDQPGIYNKEHVEVVAEIASSLAIAIQNAQLLESERNAREENIRLIDQVRLHAKQLEQRVEERTRELSALYEVTAVANEHLDLQTVLDKSLERALVTLRCIAATIHQKETDGRGLALIARSLAMGGTGLLASFDVIGSRLAYEVAGREQTVVIHDLAAHLNDPQELVLGRLRKFVGVPMYVGGKMLGVLSLFRDGAPEFSVDEVALIDSVADHLAGAIENARLRQNAEHLAVLDERSRLAREMHDSVTQALYSLTLFAEAAQDRAHERQLDLVQKNLEDISATAHEALRDMRLLLYELRTSPRLDEGLAETLSHRLKAVESRAGVRTHLISDIQETIPPDTEAGLYRIAQEALNNVLKHAEATSVLVHIYIEEDELFLEISDDGHGFIPDAVLSQGGMGLSIMRERAEAIDGELIISSERGVGTIVTAKLKLDESER